MAYIFNCVRKPRLRTQQLLIGLALFTITAAGCGASNSAAKSASQPARAPQTAVATTAAIASSQPAGAETATKTAGAASPNAIFQAKIVEPNPKQDRTWTFEPNTIKIAAGTQITWTNSGISTHTVTADDGSSFDSGAIQRGESWSFTFAKPGMYAYHCTFHNWMKGTVVVGG